jgi:hypothetical protein
MRVCSAILGGGVLHANMLAHNILQSFWGGGHTVCSMWQAGRKAQQHYVTAGVGIVLTLSSVTCM